MLRLHWRRGEPWWAKVECVPHAPVDAPDPRRTIHYRPLRARLIAVDDEPVEVMPWEHGPADWYAGAIPRIDGPPDLSPFEAYVAVRQQRDAYIPPGPRKTPP